MKNSPRLIVFQPMALLLWLTFAFSTHAQNYAVQATVQLVPPYSVYLSDYATEGNDKLRVILLQKDLSRPAYQLRLIMSVELNGKVIMRTSPFFMPPPINLDAGVPTIIAGAELAPYVDSRNIDFVGYSKEQYEKTKSLPEGAYRILFTAYDYRRQDQPVSNQGSGFYYLAKSEPPLLNYPACGTKVVMNTPQFVTFSWMPRNTASPNSAQETEYEFTLFETRPVGRNPNDVVLSTQPVFRTRTDQTQLVYGPADPLLLEDMTYVWRVQAIDRGGRDAFRNNGYSEVCTFRYGPPDVQFDVGVVKNLQAIGETPTRGKVWWDKGPYEGYKVFYRKAGDQYNWFPAQVSNPEYKIFDLEPNNEYEVRLQAIKSGALSPYSAIVKFRTPEQLPAQCGDPVEEITDPGPPLLVAQVGMRIMARDIGVNLMEVTPIAGEPGWYKGFGWVTVKFLGGARFHVQFERLYINANREATDGRIDFISKGAGALLIEKMKRDSVDRAKEITAQQQENRDAWAGTDFYSTIIHYDDIDIETIAADNASFVSITDAQGNVTSNGEVMQALNSAPTKAIIVQDKNGDQWVVQKDKASGRTKVSKVEGGGLEPGGSVAAKPQGNDVATWLIDLMLSQFDEEIAAWLRSNGKGGEQDDDIDMATALPSSFPRNIHILKHIHEATIPYFKTNQAALQGKIESINKQAFQDAVGKFSNQTEVALTKLSDSEQEKLFDASAKAIVSADAESLKTKITEKTGGGSSNCLSEGWNRGAELYEKYDFDVAMYAGMIRYFTCETSFANCGKDSGVKAYTCGLTNGFLQELDWIAMLEAVDGVTADDIADQILCVAAEIPIGGRPEDNPNLNAAIFKCLTGVEFGQMAEAVKKFVVDNWDEPYYQGQATAFVVTLLSPYKGKILEKLEKLSVYAGKIAKFRTLSKAKNADELVVVAEGLAKRIGKSQLLTKLDNLTVPNVKNWINRLDETTDASLLKKVDDLATNDPAKLAQLDDLYKNMKAPAGRKGTGDFNVQVDGKNLHYDKNGFPDFTLETPTINGRKMNFQSQSLTGNSADMATANDWALNEFGIGNFRKIPNSTKCKIKIGDEWVDHTLEIPSNETTLFRLNVTTIFRVKVTTFFAAN